MEILLLFYRVLYFNAIIQMDHLMTGNWHQNNTRNILFTPKIDQPD